jgi:hypothetical protein
MTRQLRWMTIGGAAGAAALLGGCVVAPPAYGPYGEAAYVQPAPVVVAPPVSVGIGVGGYYGRPYYGRSYYGRPGYYGRGYYGGRGYGGRGYWR